MTSPGLVVVGAGAAGVSVATALRGLGHQGGIVLVGDEEENPYDRPPLSKKVLSGAWAESRTHFRDRDWYAAQGIELVQGAAATGLDRARRLITLGGDRVLGYEHLVVATGLRPRDLPLLAAGPTPHGLHGIRTLRDVQRLKHALDSTRRAVVVGAGFLGLELASVLCEAGMAVTVVDAGPVPLARGFGLEVSNLVRRLHEDRGVELLLGQEVAEFELTHHVSGPAVAAVVTSGGHRLETTCVIAAIGSVPNTEWLAGSGCGSGRGSTPTPTSTPRRPSMPSVTSPCGRVRATAGRPAASTV